MTTRAEIAAALSTVSGVKCSAFRPRSLSKGSSWPQGPALDRVDLINFQQTWQVYIILPTGDEAASRWWDANVQDVINAISPVAYVDRLEPVLVPNGDTATDLIPAMLITARSES
jgi:hypothetical protein